MSGGTSCRCKPKKTTEQRLKRWRIVTYQGNHSAFNGYRFASSEYSSITCLDCSACWRTKAKYVEDLKDLYP